jgi:tetratricopeptide (TPR) repeat protein
MTQNNLGNAYRDLPTGDRADNLRRAIACYEAALRVYSEGDYPADWAMTQNNLGNAYSDLPTGDRADNLRRAIACYEAALRVRTEGDYPAQWAMTQNNLGAAYSDLPTGDRADNLRRAIACYEAALRVYSEGDYPADWAMTLHNRGLSLFSLGRTHDALTDYDRSLQLRSGHAGTLYDRGRAFMAIGRRPEALVDFRLSIQLGLDLALSEAGEAVGVLELIKEAGAEGDAVLARVAIDALMHATESAPDAVRQEATLQAVRAAFQTGDIRLCEQSLAVLSPGAGESVLAPFHHALAYLKGGSDPYDLDALNPDLRRAVELIASEFHRRGADPQGSIEAEP